VVNAPPPTATPRASDTTRAPAVVNAPAAPAAPAVVVVTAPAPPPPAAPPAAAPAPAAAAPAPQPYIAPPASAPSASAAARPDLTRTPDAGRAYASPPAVAAGLFPEGEDVVTLDGVTFLPWQARLTPATRDVLDDVALELRTYPDLRVEINVYTDNRGSRVRNFELSRRRARAVRTYLIQQGVSPIQLVARGRGPTNPVASNATVEGRRRNRRIELHRLY
jgi:OOP family OmpA-OmpF porin